MARKTVPFNKSGASKLPNDKPAVYRIETESGKTNYVGIAKRGRVQDRILEHLEESDIPGAKVRIQQTSSIQEAQETEARVIARSQPKYNVQGKDQER